MTESPAVWRLDARLSIGMAEQPTLIRSKRKRWKYPLHWFVTAALLLLAGSWGWRTLFEHSGGPFVLSGYVTDPEVFAQQSHRFLGRNSLDLDAQQKFQLAAESMSRRDFAAAQALLVETSKQAALPVVFSNLGVICARMNDPSGAILAFREALARDPDYAPARENLERIGGLPAPAVSPNASEVEPNDTLPLATAISLGKLVDGDIDNARSDLDWYRLIAPPPPRDRLKIDISCRSKTLSLSLSLMDDRMAALLPASTSNEPGGALSSTLSPRPGSTIYLRVQGVRGANGPYTLVVRALKAFDAYEPNDDIATSHTIRAGEAVEANIMDAQDVDCYSFTSPRTGLLTIELRNLSTSLIPAMTSFSGDMRNSLAAPDAAGPGASLKYAINAHENQVYYLQVQSRGQTAGPYTVTIQ